MMSHEAQSLKTGPVSGQLFDEVNNPCVKELKLSYKCLDDNAFDRDKCGRHFENYKACKAFWNKVKSDRRHQNIRPHLPPPEERDQIKLEHMKSIAKSK